MPDPSAAVAFLFTDIEGSTRLWEQHTAPMRAALAAHDELARAAVAAHRGHLVKRTGDGLHAAFADPLDALAAVLQMQHALADPAATAGLALALRCGLHLGQGEARDNDFFGPEVNRAARIMAAAHGGQMLLSQAVADALAGRLPAGVALRDLGEARLRDLPRPERLWQVLAPPLRGDFPALRALAATPHNLVQPLNRFIGRAQVLDQLRTALATQRLVTLLGTGGIGKSRLAQQAGALLLDDFADGVWFVELAPLADPARLPQAVAAVLGVREEPGRPVLDALCGFVADRRLLLILDNCEHLLDAAAALAKALLQASAQLRLLATSREALRVAGEWCLPVPALGVPAPSAAPQPDALLQHDAVRLLADRLASAQPAFTLTADNAAAVAEICQRLDGIPLALELAAARARALPVPVIAERLRDSFALLSTRDATVAPRQRTLRLLIDWSHDLLDDGERRLLRRLSVFAGGWTLDAAEAVCAGDGLAADAVLDRLAGLVEKSLVHYTPPAGDAPARYRLLETVRQYAAEKLADAGPEADTLVRPQHLAFYLALAEQARAAPAAPGAPDAAGTDRLDTERANLLAAHRQALAADDGAAAALRLGFALRGHWLHRGLPTTGLDMTLAALAHRGAAALPPALRARGLFDAGQLCSFMGRYAEARGHLERSLALVRAVGDSARVVSVLQPLGMAATGLGDLAQARACFDEALQRARALGQPRPLAAALNARAQLHRLEADPDAAQPLYAEALQLARATDDHETVAVALLNLAMVALGRGQPDGVRALIAEAAGLARAAGSLPAALGVLDACTGLAALAGEPALAARLHGAAASLLQATRLQRDAVDAAFLAPLLAGARTALPAADWAAAEADGQATAALPLLDALLPWLGGDPAPAATSR